jgi:hypothetical protein
MKQFKYILDPGSKKYTCPTCQKKTFVKYKDIETGNYLDDQYGRCDREINCGYFTDPYSNGFNKSEPATINTHTPKPIMQDIPFEVLKGTLQGYEQNTFIQNLLKRFPAKNIEQAISMYYLGTVTDKYMRGAVTFPFIDYQNKIRAVQVKQFDKDNHTVKTSFLHSIIERQSEIIPAWIKAYNNNEKKVSCLFGEHLLNWYPHSPIALVEAPKTAIYGALHYGLPADADNLLWLAVYNLSSLNAEKCKALKNRYVLLFPDLSKDSRAFKLWSDKARELNKKIQGAKFFVSDILEKNATPEQRNQGADIADLIEAIPT